MQIYVNDETRDITSDMLGVALDELGYGKTRIATAVDGAFVPASLRADHRLHEGARLEILAPMQGG